MNEVAKFDVQLMHRDALFKISLNEADRNDKIKFLVAGRTITLFEYKPLPIELKNLFESLDKMTFLSESELIRTLNKVTDISCLSITKKVYVLGTYKIIQNQKVESKHSLLTKPGFIS